MKEFILAILPIIMVVSCEKEPEKIKCIECYTYSTGFTSHYCDSSQVELARYDSLLNANYGKTDCQYYTK